MRERVGDGTRVRHHHLCTQLISRGVELLRDRREEINLDVLQHLTGTGTGTFRCAHATSACMVNITAAMALRSSSALIGFET